MSLSLVDEIAVVEFDLSVVELKANELRQRLAGLHRLLIEERKQLTGFK